MGEDTFVVWGGLNDNHKFVSVPYTYEVNANKLRKLTVRGEQLEERIK